jgi:hypothetical protein
MSVGVELPKGYTYDPATGAITGARIGAANPNAYVGQGYITQIDVIRTGGTLPSQKISLTGTPPPTSASFTVIPGEAYNFSVTIITNLAAPYNQMSGGTLAPVTAPPGGQSITVNILVGANGPPVVTFTADNMNPGAGSTNLKCSSVDPDADVVTLAIQTVTPPPGATALNINPATSGTPYPYTTGVTSQIDLECIGKDPSGAMGFGKLSLNLGVPPVAVPPVPTGVTALAGNAQATISWNASAGATSYNIYWDKVSPVTTASPKIAGAASPYIHTPLTNGFKYYYAVTAVNIAGESALSAEVNATPQPPLVIPPVPLGVTAVAASGQVTISWNASAGATSYNIYWSSASPATLASAKIAVATSPYVHTPLTNGLIYYYAVTAVNSAGESALSVGVSATPVSAPFTLSGTVYYSASVVPNAPINLCPSPGSQACASNGVGAIASTISDASGKYQFLAVAPGTYIVYVVPPSPIFDPMYTVGYTITSQGLTIVQDMHIGKPPISFAPTGALTTTTLIPTFNFNAQPEATLCNVNILPSPNGVTSIASSGWISCPGGIGSWPVPVGALAAGTTYDVWFNSKDAAGNYVTVQDKIYTFSTLTTTIITAIQGHVKYSTAVFVQGITVQAYNQAMWGGGVLQNAVTDVNGFYSFAGLSYTSPVPYGYDVYIDLLYTTVPNPPYLSYQWGCTVVNSLATCDFLLSKPSTVLIGGYSLSPSMTFTITPPVEAVTCAAYIYNQAQTTLIASSGAPAAFTGPFVWSPPNPIAGMSPGVTYVLNFDCLDTVGNVVSSSSSTPTSFVY